jgi:hypothetical protein
MTDIYGVFSRCFVDCGIEQFTVFDKDGEQLKEVYITHISPVRIDILSFLFIDKNFSMIGWNSDSSR